MKKNMLRFAALSVCFALVSGILAGCSSSNTGSSGDTLLDRVKGNGKIVVTLNLGNSPWSYKEVDSEAYGGMAVDLITGFAEGIGATTEFMPLEFSGLIPAIESGKADIICTNLSRTIPRSTMVLFTDPVGAAPGVAVMNKGAFASLDEINRSGVTLTTESGSIHEEVAAESFPNATMMAVNQNADAIAALKAGRADAFLTDMSVAESMKLKDSSVDYLNEFVFMDTFAFAVKLSSDSYTFIEAFNNYLHLIKLDGTYGAMYEKYFGAPWNPIYTEVGM